MNVVEPITVPCPHCGHPTELRSVQGDRCPECHFEFTLFEPGQDRVLREFWEVLTGEKYEVEIPGGARAVVHG